VSIRRSHTAGKSGATTRAARTRRLPFPPIPWRKVAIFVAIFAAIGGLFAYYGDIDAVHAAADRLNPIVAFALLVLLPLVGFPASILHVVAGIRFGGKLGLLLVSASILLQLLASYAIVRIWRDRLDRSRWLKQVRARLPEGTHSSICIFAVLLPGAPYAAINTVLPLIGVPLRTYVLCCWPIHTLRSTITVFFGDQSDRLTPSRLAVLALYALAIFAVSWWMYRRVKTQLGGQPSGADGRKQPA
jgi:uncharacterized membrane protein YdjX (TVP38/TMEM64 family)